MKDEDDKYLMFLLLIEEPSLESTSPDISPSGIFILFIPFVVSWSYFIIGRTNNSIPFTITKIARKLKSHYSSRTFYNK